jgi:hypothetical protein
LFQFENNHEPAAHDEVTFCGQRVANTMPYDLL